MIDRLCFNERNANDLIAEYWRKKNSKKGRKSTEKPSAKKGGHKSPEVPSSSTTTKRKRAKKEDSDAESDRPKGKATSKKSNGGKKIRNSEAMDVDDAEDDNVGMMENYMDQENWEKLIKTVDTVERDGDILWIYFTLYVRFREPPLPNSESVSGNRTTSATNRAQTSAKRDFRNKFVSFCPLNSILLIPISQLINFYEGHLRWKQVGEDDM